jgi:hypothetical protein
VFQCPGATTTPPHCALWLLCVHRVHCRPSWLTKAHVTAFALPTPRQLVNPSVPSQAVASSSYVGWTSRALLLPVPLAHAHKGASQHPLQGLGGCHKQQGNGPSRDLYLLLLCTAHTLLAHPLLPLTPCRAKEGANNTARQPTRHPGTCPQRTPHFTPHLPLAPMPVTLVSHLLDAGRRRVPAASGRQATRQAGTPSSSDQARQQQPNLPTATPPPAHPHRSQRRWGLPAGGWTCRQTLCHCSGRARV